MERQCVCCRLAKEPGEVFTRATVKAVAKRWAETAARLQPKRIGAPLIASNSIKPVHESQKVFLASQLWFEGLLDCLTTCWFDTYALRQRSLCPTFIGKGDGGGTVGGSCMPGAFRRSASVVGLDRWG
ncbi:hypothetical protein HZH68_011486 [Vespula germanica]|uniref:Uncharacterized protein n=2 Tax=Vespula TaxID=7451 RepID=A0A834JNN0_VESGE|nr:hypothetical protein HZH68_011486 [Vespula germanica]